MLNPKLFKTNNSKIRILIVSIICLQALSMTRDFYTLYAEKQGKKKDDQCPTKDFWGMEKDYLCMNAAS